MPSSTTFYHRLSNRHYAIREGKLRRHQLDPRGNEINILEKSIDLAIGSGNHAITYLSRTPKGVLLELPLSWYAQQNGYAMSPGYDRPDHLDMRREISDACLFCHAAYPTAGSLPKSIDCQRCHGPAAGHLLKPQRGTILNPAKLTPQRQLDVCLQCHLETVSQGIIDSIRQPMREPFSFRPGEPLASYKLYFDRADSPQPRFEVNHAGYRLLQSACLLKSNGRMTCTTCHDPHTAKARNACAGCHSSTHAKEPTDCVGCHMPKRRTNDAIHVTMTDHWIQRKPAFVDRTAENHTPYSGPIVSFYTQADPLTLAIVNSPTVELYRQQVRRHPNDVPALAALGNALYRLNRRDEAIPVLMRALNLAPGHVGALNTLGVAQATGGDYAKAIATLDRARAAHPDHALTWFNLGVTYQALNQAGKAAECYREAIRLQPDFAEARQRLGAGAVGLER